MTTTNDPIHRLRYESEPDSTREPGTRLMEGAAPIAALIARSLELHAAAAPAPTQAPLAPQAPPRAPGIIARPITPMELPTLAWRDSSDYTSTDASLLHSHPTPASPRRFLAVATQALAFVVIFVTTVAITLYFAG